LLISINTGLTNLFSTIGPITQLRQTYRFYTCKHSRKTVFKDSGWIKFVREKFLWRRDIHGGLIAKKIQKTVQKLVVMLYKSDDSHSNSRAQICSTVLKIKRLLHLW